MRVRIGGLEIVDPTWDELDELVERYGDGMDVCESVAGDDAGGRAKRPNGTGPLPSDHVVLENLISAGLTGVPTQDVGEVLGRRGKSIRPGLIEWAVRIGLVQDSSIDPFEEARVGSRRGVRLKESFLPVAKNLLSRL